MQTIHNMYSIAKLDYLAGSCTFNYFNSTNAKITIKYAVFRRILPSMQL